MIRIIYNKYVNPVGQPMIGGIQTYISNLSNVCVKHGKDVTVYQYGNSHAEFLVNNVNVVIVEKSNKPSDLISYINSCNPDYENDILIFATDFMLVSNKFKKSIAIQHGVAWDFNSDRAVSDFKNYLTAFKDAVRAIKKYNRYKNCTDLICVDYNFINWYRTHVTHINTNMHVIPNFTKIADFYDKASQENISIVFARRLVEHRGTKLFSRAIKKAIQAYPNISVTIAGTGPDEQWIKDYLKDCKNITYTSYKSSESLEFHMSFDIAVIPTKSSEGTSLSLLEAMSASCATIATNVGGMTNIILDGYNGLLIEPNENELLKAIVHLIENAEARKRIAKKGNESVKYAFSIDKWTEKWEKILFQDI